MSKADAADSDSTVRKHRQRGLIAWKPGQSGNPKGRPKGSRNKLSEEFFRDLCEAWQAFGKPALETMAMLYPAEFVRMAASLMPRELEATTTPVINRMSDAQLDAMIARCIEDES
jgi:Family of unknown function (DUF5681)